MLRMRALPGPSPSRRTILLINILLGFQLQHDTRRAGSLMVQPVALPT